MSSWKKAAQTGQRIHRERHQPESRAHLGLLEKHADYKKRANDFNRKKKTIQLLRKKAMNRNPDEFYFHMINSVIEDGIHHEVEKDDEHTPEQIKLMQTQDLRYITMKRAIEIKKIQALQSQLHLLDAANQTPNTHIFFVDSEKEARNFDVAKRLDTHPSLVNNRVNRLKLKDLEKLDLDTVDKRTLKTAAVQKKKMYAELAKRIAREKELGIIQQKLEMKKQLTTPGAAPIKVKAGSKTNAPIYCWGYERKR